MIDLAWPWMFYLLPAPLLVYLFFPKAEKQQAGLKVPFYQDLSQMGLTSSQKGSQSKPFSLSLLMIIWFLLVLACSRPTWIGEPVELPTSGRDLMLAVDISGSMEIRDLKLNGKQVQRIDVVKDVVNEFVKRREGDRIGLVLFGTQAFLQSPLTFDRKTVSTLLNEALIGFAGKDTAIGDAIGLATKRLKNNPTESRVLILLTDGANTAGEVSPIQAAELAAQLKVKIYTIGVGATEMLTRGFLGMQRVNPSRDLDEKTLSKIAELTDGQYFRAKSTKELESIYKYIDQLEPTEKEAETFRPTRALFHYPLGIAMFISLFWALWILFGKQVFSAAKSDEARIHSKFSSTLRGDSNHG